MKSYKICHWTNTQENLCVCTWLCFLGWKTKMNPEFLIYQTISCFPGHCSFSWTCKQIRRWQILSGFIHKFSYQGRRIKLRLWPKAFWYWRQNITMTPSPQSSHCALTQFPLISVSFMQENFPWTTSFHLSTCCPHCHSTAAAPCRILRQVHSREDLWLWKRGAKPHFEGPLPDLIHLIPLLLTLSLFPHPIDIDTSQSLTSFLPVLMSQPSMSTFLLARKMETRQWNIGMRWGRCGKRETGHGRMNQRGQRREESLAVSSSGEWMHISIRTAEAWAKQWVGC